MIMTNICESILEEREKFIDIGLITGDDFYHSRVKLSCSWGSYYLFVWFKLYNKYVRQSVRYLNIFISKVVRDWI